jgi:DNA-binding PadR family transcriptional regulator
MGKYQLGEFEEVVLLTVAVLYGEAYGFAIIEEIEKRLNRKVSIGSLQTVLRRLEKKGYLSSEFGEATNVRGGKRKRFFTVTDFGQKVLSEVKQQRIGLWNAIPEIAFDK